MKKILFIVVLLLGAGSSLNAETENEKLCKNGSIRNCVISAYDARREKDFTKAMEYFLKGCNGNWGEACFSLAIGNEEGEGVEKNLLKAEEYFRKACKLDGKSYCWELGKSYRDGRFVEKNLLKAKESFFKGCKLSSGSSCVSLGNMYELEEDYTNAKKYYLKACTEHPSIGFGCSQYQDLKMKEPEVVDCEILKMRFKSCVNRSYKGLECFEGTDIVLPKRCR